MLRNFFADDWFKQQTSGIGSERSASLVATTAHSGCGFDMVALALRHMMRQKPIFKHVQTFHAIVQIPYQYHFSIGRYTLGKLFPSTLIRKKYLYKI